MMVPELQTVAQFFMERLLNTAAEGVVLACLVWVLLRLVSRQNSGTRFAIWFSALLAIAALPFFSGSSFVASHFPALHPANLRRLIILPSSLAFCLFTAWVAGAGLLLLRLSVGLWRVRRFRRNCSDVDLAGLDPAIARILHQFESRRRVKLCVSSGAAVPGAIGFLRPAIVFPAWLLPQLSAEEIKLVLLHELAHLRRWDDWSNLAQKTLKAVFFFHPAVWWIENRLTLEREMACDDIVLAQTVSPRAYASSLISFAEKLQGSRGLALAQALVTRMHQMSLRVAQILDPKRPRCTGRWRPLLGFSAGIVALILGAAPYMPQVVAFRARLSQSPTQHVQTQRVLNAVEQRAAAPAMIRPAAEHVAQSPRIAPQPRMISAAFHTSAAVAPRHLKVTSPRRPAVMRATAWQEESSIQATIVILRTTQYDASGSEVWTLCIWRVGGKDSSIFVGSI